MCMAYNISFRYKSWLKKQMTEHNNYKFVCAICNNKYTYEDSLLRHINVHESPNLYKVQCSTYHNIFSNNYNLSIHMKTIYLNNEVTCAICEKILSDKRSVRYHLNRFNFTENKPYKCKDCGLTLFAANSLCYHRKSVR